MTTQAEVKRLVRPLLERNFDLVLSKRDVYIQPIYHMLRGIGIYRTSSKFKFMVSWVVMPLCIPAEMFIDIYANDITPSKLWNIALPDVAIHLADRVEQCGLPVIRKIETIDDFCNLDLPITLRFRSWRHDERRKPFIDAACGRFDEAAELCRKIKSDERSWRAAKMDDEFEAIANVLYPLVVNRDLKGLANQLREWEAFTARNLGIEQYWEPTPFPFEEQR